ncbi:hypothetical protein KR200_011024 [Drosophila serrata]|nr:hypothetical protein KR200_011024 [Drosophila serrata]
MKEIYEGNLEFAVEFAHDENLLKSHGNVSTLSEFLALLTLKTGEDQTEDFHILHEKLMQLKLESHQLDANFHSPDYYAQKEELIFKVVCEMKGIDHDKWLREEQGFGESTTPFGDFVQDEFVCDDFDNA